MADRMPAFISLGGRVPANLADRLLTLIQEEDGRQDWGGEPFSELVPQDEWLAVYDQEATSGEFDRLEKFCREHSIAYDRHSDGLYEYDAENVYFRQGMTEPVCRLSTQAGSDVVHRDDVTDALWHLQAGDALNAEECLQKALGPTVPPLEPFEIVAEAAAAE